MDSNDHDGCERIGRRSSSWACLLASAILACAIAATPVLAQDQNYLAESEDEVSEVTFGSAKTPPIPIGFFDGPGINSNQFQGTVFLMGKPFDPFSPLGDTSTITRFPNGPPVFPPFPPPSQIMVPIEIIQLSLVSVQPITVTFASGPPELWEVAVEHSSHQPPMGQLTIRKTHPNGGTFDSQLFVHPKFTFTRVQPPDGETRTFEPWTMGFPEIALASLGDHWVQNVNPTLGVVVDPGTTFVPGIQQVGTSQQEQIFDERSPNGVIHWVCPAYPPPPPPEDYHAESDAGPTSVSFGTAAVPAIPGDFFDPGSEPFDGTVLLIGSPIDIDALGDTSTIIRRHGPPVLPTDPDGTVGTVPIEIIALNLVSVSPITVTYGSGNTEDWDVAVTLSTRPAPMGQLTATKTHPNGGTFDTTLFVQAKFTFTRGGVVRVLDTGNPPCQTPPCPPQPPIMLQSVGDHFVHIVDPALGVVVHPDSNWVPGIEEVDPGDITSQEERPADEQSTDADLSVTHWVCPAYKRVCIYAVDCKDSESKGACDNCALTCGDVCTGQPCVNVCPTYSNLCGDLECCIEATGVCVVPPIPSPPACPPGQPCICAPQGGACCNATGVSCSIVADECACDGPGDRFIPGATTCGPTVACCFSDNTCQDMAQACCINRGGTPTAGSCAQNPCDGVCEPLVDGSGCTQSGCSCFGECINGGYCDDPACCLDPNDCLCYAPHAQESIKLCGDCFGECIGGSYCDDPAEPNCWINPGGAACYVPNHEVSIYLCKSCFGQCINGSYCDGPNPDCCIAGPTDCQCYAPTHPISLKMCSDVDRCEARCVRYNPFTGQNTVTDCDCVGWHDCHINLPGGTDAVAGTGNTCVVTGSGGTVSLPPEGCGYLSPDDVHVIINGLPVTNPPTTIEVAVEHKSFFCQVCTGGPNHGQGCNVDADCPGGICRSQNPECSIGGAPAVICDQAGGSLGGEKECAHSTLELNMNGTGNLSSFNRMISLPVAFETHTAPRIPGQPLQSFDTDMFRLAGQITNPGSGDPDFDLLRITAGTGYGLPSPGHTTLTQLPGGSWAVDSYFDISYRIDFVGKQGGALSGMSGSTTGTIRMATGSGPSCVGQCPPNTTCHETRVVNADGTIDICCDCRPSPICEPNDAGTACRPFDCPNTDEECVPQVVSCPPGQTYCFVTDCDCADPDLCHVDLTSTGQPYCVNPCPDVVDACRLVGTDSDGDGVDDLFSCDCIPPPDCEPNTAGTACNPITCPDTGTGVIEKCMKKCVILDEATGAITLSDCDCVAPGECHMEFAGLTGGGNVAGSPTPPAGAACIATEDPLNPGTVKLPPDGCPYLSPDEYHQIVDGLPPGVTVQIGAIHKDFMCRAQAGTPNFCSFTPPPGADCEDETPKDSTDGAKECHESTLELHLDQTGMPSVAGPGPYSGIKMMPVRMETHTGPRIPGMSPQSFDTDMFRLQGQLPAGDPDFDLLRITAGTDFGMPSPGHTTLTRIGGGPRWGVDSFFDIHYVIEFTGKPCPGSIFCGRSGSTTGTIRMATNPFKCADNCPQGTICVEKRTPIAGTTQTKICCECQQDPPPCEPNDLHNGCKAHVCPDPLDKCVPQAVVCPQPGAPCEVIACDCDDDCHVDLNAAGQPYCVNPCPNAADTCRLTGTGTAADPYICICQPPAECEPNDLNSGCNPITCPMGPAGPEKCKPKCVILGPNGQATLETCDCVGDNECHMLVSNGAGGAGSVAGGPIPPECVVPDNGGGTVTLPPAGCDYLSPDQFHEIVNGLPAGTTIEVAAIHKDFACGERNIQGVCNPPVPGVDCVDENGGALGGDSECSDSKLVLHMKGQTGMVAGPATYEAMKTLPVRFETHTAPRNPGDPVQSFDTDMFRLQGQLPGGDPDFDLLRIRAGTGFGMPSPGHTTLTRMGPPGSNWAVDSFFDVFYEIEFVGKPGGPLGGMHGSTTGTIRMATKRFKCTRDCPVGSTCKEVRTTVAGGIKVCCECEPDVPQVCEPVLPDRQQCNPNTCPPGVECRPKTIRCNPPPPQGDGRCEITECDCNDGNQCHPELPTGTATVPTCAGACPAPSPPNKCVRKKQPVAGQNGAFDYTCRCVPVHPAPTPGPGQPGKTRHLGIQMPASPANTAGPGVQVAVRIIPIDLQHPSPANVPQNPPNNFTTYDTRVNGVCSGGSVNGHHCDTDADCRVCDNNAGGAGLRCTSNAECRRCVNDNSIVCTSNADCISVGGNCGLAGTCPATGGTCVNLTGCTAANEQNGCARWVGRPQTHHELQDVPALGNYRAARLGCAPYYHDWSMETTVNVNGAEIAPSSRYAVQFVDISCPDLDEECFSEVLEIGTGRHSDIAFPYSPPSGTTQPDATDVLQLVNKFRNVPGAPSKPISHIRPNAPDPNEDVDARDIRDAVDAVKQFGYAYSGPCPCPSLATCGALECMDDSVCIASALPGLGIGSVCTRTCVGGANDGMPCRNNNPVHNHCPSGVCGPVLECRGGPMQGQACTSDSGCPQSACGIGYCRDRCVRCRP